MHWHPLPIRYACLAYVFNGKNAAAGYAKAAAIIANEFLSAKCSDVAGVRYAGRGPTMSPLAPRPGPPAAPGPPLAVHAPSYRPPGGRESRKGDRERMAAAEKMR